MFKEVSLDLLESADVQGASIHEEAVPVSDDDTLVEGLTPEHIQLEELITSLEELVFLTRKEILEILEQIDIQPNDPQAHEKVMNRRLSNEFHTYVSTHSSLTFEESVAALASIASRGIAIDLRTNDLFEDVVEIHHYNQARLENDGE